MEKKNEYYKKLKIQRKLIETEPTFTPEINKKNLPETVKSKTRI